MVKGEAAALPARSASSAPPLHPHAHTPQKKAKWSARQDWKEKKPVLGTIPPYVTLSTAVLKSSLGSEQHVQLCQALLEASYALIIILRKGREMAV